MPAVSVDAEPLKKADFKRHASRAPRKNAASIKKNVCSSR
jgi:hypothetical protein